MSGLGQEFPGKVRGENVDATTPESVNAVKELGFGNHGIVIRDSSGKVLWKQADHQVKIEDVRGALRGILQS